MNAEELQAMGFEQRSSFMWSINFGDVGGYSTRAVFVARCDDEGVLCVEQQKNLGGVVLDWQGCEGVLLGKMSVAKFKLLKELLSMK